MTLKHLLIKPPFYVSWHWISTHYSERMRTSNFEQTSEFIFLKQILYENRAPLSEFLQRKVWLLSAVRIKDVSDVCGIYTRSPVFLSLVYYIHPLISSAKLIYKWVSSIIHWVHLQICRGYVLTYNYVFNTPTHVIFQNRIILFFRKDHIILILQWLYNHVIWIILFLICTASF